MTRSAAVFASSRNNARRSLTWVFIVQACTAASGVMNFSLAAQVPREATGKIAVVGADFSLIGAARELSDCRVLVTDRRARELLVLDPRTLGRKIVGRNGEGPGEYGTPTLLWAVGPDSTVLLDSGKRLLLLSGASFVPTTEAMRKRNGVAEVGIEGFDERGNMLRVVGIDRLKPGERIRWTESAANSAVLAAIRTTVAGRKDTIARLRGGYGGPPKQFSVPRGGATEFFELGDGIPTSEQAGIFPDGRIALALQKPYRVDWILPDGKRIAGPTYANAEQLVTTAVKSRVASEHRMPGAKPADFPRWPTHVPPFQFNALTAGLDGRLYIRRTVISINDSVTYDVIDQTGARRSFALPPRARLVGGGTRGLYVVTRDEDDLETLSLYKLPP